MLGNPQGFCQIGEWTYNAVCHSKCCLLKKVKPHQKIFFLPNRVKLMNCQLHSCSLLYSYIDVGQQLKKNVKNNMNRKLNTINGTIVHISPNFMFAPKQREILFFITSKDFANRVEICRDRHNRRSCKICSRCVNFPRKQCNFSHNWSRTTRFTHTPSVILH